MLVIIHNLRSLDIRTFVVDPFVSVTPSLDHVTVGFCTPLLILLLINCVQLIVTCTPSLTIIACPTSTIAALSTTTQKKTICMYHKSSGNNKLLYHSKHFEGAINIINVC